MPLTIRRLTNTSDTQRMRVHFPHDAFEFTLAAGASTHLGEQSRDIPVLREVQPSPENAITIVVAMFPGLNWYVFADTHERVWLSSDSSGPFPVPIDPRADRARLELLLAFAAPNLSAALR